MFFDHKGIRLETNIRKITENSPNTWKQINTLLNNPGAKKESLQGNYGKKRKETHKTLNLIKHGI